MRKGKQLLLFSVIGAISWVFLSAPPERPSGQSSRAATTHASARSNINAGHSYAIVARQDPIPLVRSAGVSPASTVPPAASEVPAITVERDELDRLAAKAAAEQDGYKRVSIIGKGSNGGWRAKGFRGMTEVLLTVDDTGRVSMD